MSRSDAQRAAEARYRSKNRESRRLYAQQRFASDPDAWRACNRRSRSKKVGPQVYVCFDESGSVIYVGRTTIWYEREKTHRVNSPWWPLVSKVRRRTRKSPADAMVLEALLIRKHQPKYNKDGVTR